MEITITKTKMQFQPGKKIITKTNLLKCKVSIGPTSAGLVD